MSNTIKYYLDDLWNFSDKQILQILKHFKSLPSEPINNRLDAIILSYNNDLLEDQEIKYVESEKFDALFLLNDEQLKIMAENLGYSDKFNRIDMIKFIIDNDIKIVNFLPTQIKNNIEIYQINNNIFVCGNGTYNIKDKLKMIGGRWDSKNKCWSLPLESKSEAIKLIPKKEITKLIVDKNIKEEIRQITPDIELITQIPKTIPHNLQAYQINNIILLCGKRTYDLKDELKSINSKFNGTYKCWDIPHDQIDYILDLIDENAEKDKLDKIKIEEKKRNTRISNLQKKQEMEEKKNVIKERLNIKEPELPYIKHLDRLTPAELKLLKEQYSYDEIYDMMEELDVQELKEIWDNKIQLIDNPNEASKLERYQGSYYYVTYTGNYRPPNQVLEYWANGWRPIQIGAPGYSVKRIDYKTYEIHKFYTD